jgi:hypothetical protein
MEDYSIAEKSRRDRGVVVKRRNLYSERAAALVRSGGMCEPILLRTQK